MVLPRTTAAVTGFGLRIGAAHHSSKTVRGNARLKAAFFIVEPNQEQPTGIADLLDAGDLQAFVGGVFPFTQASAADCGKPTETHRPGKLVMDLMQR